MIVKTTIGARNLKMSQNRPTDPKSKPIETDKNRLIKSTLRKM